ncbi:MAG: hypothetical protein LBD20_01505, partial [Spirochaetaceae bacterium]|nr:hypothetical protein [Spirochaetaceae bacterium]
LNLKLYEKQGFVITMGAFFALLIFFAIIHYSYNAIRIHLPPPPPHIQTKQKIIRDISPGKTLRNRGGI